MRVIAPVDLDHIAIQIYGPRNQLLGHCKVPAAELQHFMSTVNRVQAINPAHSAASVVRWVVRMGWKQLLQQALPKGKVAIPTGE